MAAPEHSVNGSMNGNGEMPQPEFSMDTIENMEPYVYDFEWLKDENLLRDEGSLFGLTTDDPKEKVATINSFYDEFIAQVERSLELFEDRIVELKLQKEATEQLIVDLGEQLHAAATTYSLAPHQFWRTLAGLVGYTFLIIFNLWLVVELTPDAGDGGWKSPILIALGVYTFGLFSAFQKHHQIYPAEQENIPRRQLWKVYLEEFMIPVVATAFVLSGIEQKMTPFQWIGIGGVLLFLFLFAGKGLFLSISSISSEFKVRMENRLKNKYRKTTKRKLQLKIAKLEGKIDQLEQDLATVQDKKLDRSLQLEKLKRKKETVIAYFMSEFKLAQGTRHHFHRE